MITYDGEPALEEREGVETKGAPEVTECTAGNALLLGRCGEQGRGRTKRCQ